MGKNLTVVCVVMLFAIVFIWGLACEIAPLKRTEIIANEPTINDEIPAEIPENIPQIKLLSTDLDNNELVFSGKETKSFLLYNNGNTNIVVTSLLIDRDIFNGFSLAEKLAFPTTLKPGKDNGVLISVKYSSDRTSPYSAYLKFSSDAENISKEGFFVVTLFYQ